MAYELLKEKVFSGKITPETKLCVPSSGNTGLGIAGICKALGLKCEIVMSNDTPAPKVGSISALGHPVDVTLLSSGTVQYAREKSSRPGWDTIDQYSEPKNFMAQFTYLAPQLWTASDARIDILIVPGGTLGTAAGFRLFFLTNNLPTTLVLAICADGQEIPGARDEKRIGQDVTIAKVSEFEHVMTATRYQAFFASYMMFGGVDWMPGGPTSGLSLFAALKFLQKHKIAGTLEQFRRSNEKIRVIFLCPDDYRLYGDLYRSTVNTDDFASSSIPVSKLLEI